MEDVDASLEEDNASISWCVGGPSMFVEAGHSLGARFRIPALESMAQRCVMNFPPLARCSMCASALSDGATYRIVSAQNFAITFQRASSLSSSSSHPRWTPL